MQLIFINLLLSNYCSLSFVRISLYTLSPIHMATVPLFLYTLSIHWTVYNLIVYLYPGYLWDLVCKPLTGACLKLNSGISWAYTECSTMTKCCGDEGIQQLFGMTHARDVPCSRNATNSCIIGQRKLSLKCHMSINLWACQNFLSLTVCIILHWYLYLWYLYWYIEPLAVALSACDQTHNTYDQSVNQLINHWL